MTEKLLRDSLAEAQKKEQLGLLIWKDSETWEELQYQFGLGRPRLDNVIFQIQKNNFIEMRLGFIAVSVSKIGASEELFDKLLEACQKGLYEGPITLIPKNE